MQSGQQAAARGRRPPRAARDPRCGAGDAERRPHVRPAGPDGSHLAAVARRGTRVPARGAVPVSALRAAADHAGPEGPECGPRGGRRRPRSRHVPRAVRRRRRARPAGARRAAREPRDPRRRSPAPHRGRPGAHRRDRTMAVLRGRAPPHGGVRAFVKLDILYRGPLASCNYGCEYCPFAKRKDSREQLAVDRSGWRRFVDRVATLVDDQLGILVTPWGEALIRRWYQDGLAELSHLPQVTRVAAQTNLSCDLGWIRAADPARLALW